VRKPIRLHRRRRFRQLVRGGAVVVPVGNIDAIAAALDGLMKREAKIIAAARVPGATAASIKAAMKG